MKPYLAFALALSAAAAHAAGVTLRNGDLVVSDITGSGSGVQRVDPPSGAQVPLASGGSFSNPTGIAVVGALTVPARRATWGEVKARYAR